MTDKIIYIFIIISLTLLKAQSLYENKQVTRSSIFRLRNDIKINQLKTLNESFVADSIEIQKFSSGRDFLNHNLHFTDFSSSVKSSLTVTGEIAAGSLLGYGCGKLMHSLFRPKEIDGNFLGTMFQSIFVFLGSTFGTATGIYLFGKASGHEGNYFNMIIWMGITVTVFGAIADNVTDDEDDRFWISAAGLPVGAAIGFNTNNLWELLSIEL